MKVREWLSKGYVIVCIGILVNLIIAAVWISHREPRAAENTLTLPSDHPSVRYHIDKPPEITEDTKLVIELSDSSEFSISIKEARALRKAIGLLLSVRLAKLEGEIVIAKGGVTVGTTRTRHLRLLEVLAAELKELHDILSVQERK